MMEDPRWQQALRHLTEATAALDRDDTEEMGRGFRSFCNALDSLALDPVVPRDQRRRAAAILDRTRAPIRARLPELLRRIAELRDTATDAAERAEFAAMLAEATEQLPLVSNARH